MPKIRIPKQTDREVVSALGKVAEALGPQIYLVRLHPPQFNGTIDLEAEKQPEKNPHVDYIFSAENRLVDTIQLINRASNRTTVTISRRSEDSTDLMEVGPDSYFTSFPEADRSSIYVKVVGACRRELKVSDIESPLDGLGDRPWTQYLESQRQILNSLQSATQRLLVDAAKRNDEFEAERQRKYEQMEAEFRARAENERQKIEEEKKKAIEVVEAAKSDLQKRIEAFNTKEARYVARQKQVEQIDQLKVWLEGWSLTRGTVEKRAKVELAYAVGALACLVLTLVASVQSYLIIEKAKDLAAINGWEWLALTLKTTVPFLLFATLLTYYIRWNGAWAKQHAEEEFRNRARLIDIGRSSWLLEAVRDAQDNKQIIPVVLLRELSKNMFSATNSPDADVHPKAVNDLVMQGLKMVSVSTPDGSKFKAERK